MIEMAKFLEHILRRLGPAIDCHGVFAARLKPRPFKSKSLPMRRHTLTVLDQSKGYTAPRSIPASSFFTVLDAHAMRGVLCAMPNCPCEFRTMMPPWPFKRCFR